MRPRRAGSVVRVNLCSRERPGGVLFSSSSSVRVWMCVSSFSRFSSPYRGSNERWDKAGSALKRACAASRATRLIRPGSEQKSGGWSREGLCVAKPPEEGRVRCWLAHLPAGIVHVPVENVQETSIKLPFRDHLAKLGVHGVDLASAEQVLQLLASFGELFQ
eukprot:scaffold11611_cov129-Isochrysis_galbana.AAC.3